MPKRWIVIIFFLLLGFGCLHAQNLSGETEVGSDGKGEGFISQYIFFDTDKVNGLGRYFYVNGILQRGEFAVGPTLKLNNSNTLKLTFGGTTDQEVMVGGTLILKFKGRDVVLIEDGKFATQTGAPHTLYQKLFVPIIKSGRWQFRWEHLLVGGAQSFSRWGIEYQQPFPDSTHLYIAPFYDPLRKAVGGQFGLRFF